MAEPLKKKRGRPLGSTTKSSNTTSEVLLSPVFSRSGRKIKVKEFADGSHFELMQTSPEVKQEFPSNPPISSKRIKTERKQPIKKNLNDNFEPVTIKVKLGDLDSLQIKIERSDDEFGSDIKAVRAEARKLKSRIEKGESIPSFIQDKINDIVKQRDKIIERERKQRFAVKDLTAKEFDYMVEMADCDVLIKHSLSASPTKVDMCIKAFNRLEAIPVTQQIILKFPIAFETARNVFMRIEQAAVYVDVEHVDEVKIRIRDIAEKVYEKYKSVFPYCKENNFWTLFEADVDDYQSVSDTMTAYDYYSSTRLPNRKAWE